MSFSKDDNKKLDKKAREEGYRNASSFNGYVNNNGDTIKKDGNSWNFNGDKKTDWNNGKKQF